VVRFHLTTLSTLQHFADDTFTLYSGEDLNDLINNVNNKINKIAVWFRANKLAVDISKTKYIIFRMKGKKLLNNMPSVIYNANEPGQQYDNSLITELDVTMIHCHDNHESPDCRSYKYLGIYLDEHFTL
jgi:hypothetical protein